MGDVMWRGVVWLLLHVATTLCIETRRYYLPW
jgi:hypothetical protein